MYMNSEIEIVAIVDRIEKILQNPRGESIDMLGSYIVGATIIRDDIEDYYTKYPLLEKIAELGADLETLGNSDFAEDVLLEIKTNFHKLKEEVKSKR
jgi:hypothetical protein